MGSSGKSAQKGMPVRVCEGVFVFGNPPVDPSSVIA